jgi:hypothetical protein
VKNGGTRRHRPPAEPVPRQQLAGPDNVIAERPQHCGLDLASIDMTSRDSLDRLLDSTPALGAWVAEAACADPAADLADVYTADAPEAQDVALATVVCSGCSVRRECADYAARTGAYGLWGATWRGRRARNAPAA